MSNSIAFIERIAALHGITLQMAEQNDESNICRVAVEQGTASLDIDRLAVFGPDEDPEYMRGTWGTDSDGGLTDESEFRAPIHDREMVTRTLSRRDLVAVDESVTLLWRHIPVGFGWNAMVAMWHGEEILGWIFADNLINRRPFSEEDEEILKLLAASLGQMLRRVRAENSLRKMNQELEQRIAARTAALEAANARLEVLSRTDALTGLSNRRALEDLLPREMGRARRTACPMSILAVDVDYFKPYNDTLGHQAGDECLVALAELLQAQCRRSTDLAVRMGGEEFLIMLPDVGFKEAHSVAADLQLSLHKARLPHPKSPISDRLTLSIGLISAVPEEATGNLLKLADEALYRAKANGRNRVEGIQL